MTPRLGIWLPRKQSADAAARSAYAARLPCALQQMHVPDPQGTRLKKLLLGIAAEEICNYLNLLSFMLVAGVGFEHTTFRL